MSEIRVDNIKNSSGAGSPTFPNGIQNTGVSTFSDNVFVGSAITMFASSGIISATSLNLDGALDVAGNATVTGDAFVGSAITMFASSGIVSATAFFGDGAGITNAGSQLSAASGSQRLVVTSQTSGTMTAAATDADLSFDADGNVLSSANLIVSGIATLGSSNGIGTVTVGVGTTALLVDGNARVTGILTVGTASVTIDGTTNSFNVGTAVTVNSGGMMMSGIMTTGIGSIGSNATGNRTIQSGGSASGGANGDIYYIY